MKRLVTTPGLLLLLFSFSILLTTCGKDEPAEPGQPTIPVVSTAAVGAVTQTTAECGGVINSDGGAAVIARGVCWSPDQTPTIADDKTIDGAGTGDFTSFIIGLTVGTRYYVQAYATNSVATAYGGITTFATTDSMGAMADIDGNSYRTVKIGSQWWMAENLKVTHYRDGSVLPNVLDLSTWYNLTTGAYCNHGNDTINAVTYGRLYNWYAVTDSHNIAPEGWHMPTDTEWQALVDYLGGDSVAGGKLKEAGTAHWGSPNSGTTNESGFSALPGGDRTYGDYNMYTDALFWSSTEGDSIDAWSRQIIYAGPEIYRNFVPKQWGYSVRCIKD